MARQTKLILLWLFCTVPATAIGGAIATPIVYMFVPTSGFLSFPPSVEAIFGAIYAAVWAVCLVLPHLFVVSAWAKLAGGSETRAGLLVGMLVCALPQAVVLAMVTDSSLFLPAWFSVALGLWLPRAVFPGLRPGVFAT